MKEKKVQEALSHSQHALRAISQLAQGNQELQAACHHLKAANQKMEHQVKKGTKRQEANQTQAQAWWETVTSGVSQSKTAAVPQSKIAEQAAARTLKQLNAMLDAEQKKINELELKTKPQPKADQQSADDGPVTPQQHGQVFLS